MKGAQHPFWTFARKNRLLGVQETEFERFVREHEIPEMLWGQSIAVREWAKKNAERRYIPEHVLAAFNITVKSTWSDFAERGL
jgi:hypothetical protein